MFVTDTHPLVYQIARKYTRFGKRARKLFEDADQGRTVIYVPSCVLWEVADRVKDGTLVLPQRFDYWCRSLNASAGFIIEPLHWEDVNEARSFPFSDPFDCLIAGTATRLGLPLITRDLNIVESGMVETVW